MDQQGSVHEGTLGFELNRRDWCGLWARRTVNHGFSGGIRGSCHVAAGLGLLRGRGWAYSRGSRARSLPPPERIVHTSLKGFTCWSLLQVPQALTALRVLHVLQVPSWDHVHSMHANSMVEPCP